MMVGQGRAERTGRKALISRSLNYLLEFVALVFLSFLFSGLLFDFFFPCNIEPLNVLLQDFFEISSSCAFTMFPVAIHFQLF